MRLLRLWIAITMGWLLFIFNIERFNEPINISSFVYVLTAIVAMGIVAFEPLGRISAMLSWGASTLVLLALKPLLGHPVFGDALPLTVTEAVVLAFTVWLAREIAKHISAFEEASVDVMTSQVGMTTESFDTGQEEMYREVRRAREYERPLSLLVVSPIGESSSRSMNRLIREVQRKSIQQYVLGRVAQILTKEVGSSDIIAVRDDHFVVVLPEHQREDVETLVEEMRKTTQEELGLDLITGVSSFPQDETTFTGLLDRAEDLLQISRKHERKKSCADVADVYTGACSHSDKQGCLLAQKQGSGEFSEDEMEGIVARISRTPR